MAFEVRSNTGDAFVTIGRDGDSDSDYVATLRSSLLHASLGFYDLSLDPLVDMFARAAADWQGWKDERSWRSLEGNLSIALTHDGLGTVGFLVRLVEARATPREWSVEALLEVDAGALDRIARDARRHLA